MKKISIGQLAAKASAFTGSLISVKKTDKGVSVIAQNSDGLWMVLFEGSTAQARAYLVGVCDVFENIPNVAKKAA